MLRLSVHVVRLTASTAMIQENISLLRANTRRSVPSFPYPVPTIACEVGSVPREDMEAHRKECPLEMIQCEYYSVGCKHVKLAHKDQEKHDNEKMKEHLMMTKLELGGTQRQLTDAKAQLAIVLKQINNLAQLVMMNSTSSSPTNIRWSIILDVMAIRCAQ